jgi:hypothetical protein
MAETEAYGDFLNHGAHYDHWINLAALGALELQKQGLPDIFCWSEYEEWPRGRVVFHRPSGRFTLYADRTLQTPATIRNIIRRFSLPADLTDIRSDAHYVVAGG